MCHLPHVDYLDLTPQQQADIEAQFLDERLPQARADVRTALAYCIHATDPQRAFASALKNLDPQTYAPDIELEQTPEQIDRAFASRRQ